jgi:hypothetical protein
MVGLLHRSRTTTGGRPVQIKLREMRETGVRAGQRQTGNKVDPVSLQLHSSFSSAAISMCLSSAIALIRCARSDWKVISDSSLAHLVWSGLMSHHCLRRSHANEGNIVMSDDDVKAELERLRRENEALKKGRSEGVRMKVSEKGAVSIYGMGRFPVTLYKEQWLKLLNMSDEIRSFIAENEERLKAKD